MTNTDTTRPTTRELYQGLEALIAQLRSGEVRGHLPTENEQDSCDLAVAVEILRDLAAHANP